MDRIPDVLADISRAVGESGRRGERRETVLQQRSGRFARDDLARQRRVPQLAVTDWDRMREGKRP